MVFFSFMINPRVNQTQLLICKHVFVSICMYGPSRKKSRPKKTRMVVKIDLMKCNVPEDLAQDKS